MARNTSASSVYFELLEEAASSKELFGEEPLIGWKQCRSRVCYNVQSAIHHDLRFKR